MFKHQLEQSYYWQKTLLICLWIFIVAGAMLGLSLSIKFDIDQNNNYSSHKL